MARFPWLPEDADIVEHLRKLNPPQFRIGLLGFETLSDWACPRTANPQS